MISLFGLRRDGPRRNEIRTTFVLGRENQSVNCHVVMQVISKEMMKTTFERDRIVVDKGARK